MTDKNKNQVALAALDYVEDGMRLGLGTGSTAALFVAALGEKVAGGLSIVGIPTSASTRDLALQYNIALTDLDATPHLDLTIDGADEIGPGLALIKGGGGALLREKIVASASERMIVIADDSKIVDQLGRFPLPVEIVPFAGRTVEKAIASLSADLGLNGEIVRRSVDGHPFVSDEGNHILDISYRHIPDPATLAASLSQIAGIVDHGLFLGLADLALVAGASGVLRIEA